MPRWASELKNPPFLNPTRGWYKANHRITDVEEFLKPFPIDKLGFHNILIVGKLPKASEIERKKRGWGVFATKFNFNHKIVQLHIGGSCKIIKYQNNTIHFNLIIQGNLMIYGN